MKTFFFIWWYHELPSKELVIKPFLFIWCYHELPRKEIVMKPFFFIWCYNELPRKEMVMKSFFFIWCYHELVLKELANSKGWSCCWRRKTREAHNKTTKHAMEIGRKHIESFLAVDGHYTRKDSSRKYLGADINITRMHQLYLEELKGKEPGNEIVSTSIYREIFNEEHNYSFRNRSTFNLSKLPQSNWRGVCFGRSKRRAWKASRKKDKRSRWKEKKAEISPKNQTIFTWQHLISMQFYRHYTA